LGRYLGSHFKYDVFPWKNDKRALFLAHLWDKDWDNHLQWYTYHYSGTIVVFRSGGGFFAHLKTTKMTKKASVLSFPPKQRKWQSISYDAGQN
jgi:hypothetical protein